MDEVMLKEVALAGIYFDGLLECERYAIIFWARKYPIRARALKNAMSESLDVKTEEAVENGYN